MPAAAPAECRDCQRPECDAVPVCLPEDLRMELEERAAIHTGGDVADFIRLCVLRELRPTQFAEIMAARRRVA